MSEREYEPDETDFGWVWWPNPQPRPDRGHLPREVFAALDGGEREEFVGESVAYPTREAALAALAAARAKAGGGADPDELLDELDAIARGYDRYEYGLPWADGPRAEMRAAVLRFLARAEAAQ